MAFVPFKLSSNSDASFSPLFRLLDEFNNHYSPEGPRRRTALPTWQPNFDIRETQNAFELHGEFPGMKKEDVHIKFTEPQTMLIHGKTERSYSNAPSSGLIENSSVEAIKDADAQSESHKATVEDENNESKQVEKAQPQEKPVDKAKYWVTERSIGEFSRTFSFPTQVDQDSVTATFKDGILSITVPKAKKYESRRITVN